MAKVFYSGPAITEFHPATDAASWYFSVHKPFTVRWKKIILVVPKGFKTDLASIPQILQNVIPLVGNHLQAAIVHDLCYRSMVGISKDDADQMFYDSMRQLSVFWLKAQAMYRAVQVFGGGAFKGG